jgi:hypothetical protein
MPDRAIIPLLPALSLGFLCGIIASALLLGDGATLAVGIVGGIATALAAGSSVFGVRGEKNEKAIVAALRVGTAVGLYACIYLFILGFLREGKVVAALIWLPMAIAFAILLTRLDVRDREETQGETREASS